MQGNRDGSWSLGASANGGSGSGRGNGSENGVPGGYFPQANPVFSNFSVQQPIRYPLPQFPANFYRPDFCDLTSFSLGNGNFQTQQNLNFHHGHIPHQFGSGANVFLQTRGQSFSLPRQAPPNSVVNNDISASQNRGASGASGSSSLKRRRQEIVQGTDVVVKEPPKSTLTKGESANSLSVSLPRVGTDGSCGGSRVLGGNGSSEKSSSKPKRKVEVIRIDQAVNKTRKSVVSAGESVSSTRVSRSVLEELQADSWRSLGVQMQDVPSLRQLMALEGKVNAFIHCFVGARRIVTLHDLEVAICQNEFVDCFEDLELGPLLQHPLVLLYFPSISGSDGPVQITSEEIISFLDSYLNTYDMDDVKLDEFLNFVAEKKSVTSKEKLGVRIQSLRMYVSFIQDAKKQEVETLKILLTELHQKYHILSPKKKRQDKPLTVSERADSFALHHKDYRGKHTRFYSSSSDENDSADDEVENVSSIDHLSSCPYPSVAEEMKRLGGSNKKRKTESRNHEKSDPSKLLRKGPSKLRRGDSKQEIPKSADDSDAKQVFGVNEADFTLSEGALRSFISTWKDTCKELSMSMFVEKMLSFYNSGGSEGRAQIKRAKAMSSFPFVGLLNVAVTSMRRGMCDSIYDNLQTTSQSEMDNPVSGIQVDDIKPSESSGLKKSQHIVPPNHSNTVEEIVRRLSLNFEHDFSGEKHISILKKLQTCESLLAEQFQVQDFESLGWGGFFTFLEKNMSLLPTQLERFLTRELREESPLEVHVNENLLTLLLSQASEFSGGNVISRQMVARLLAEQFPSINLKVVGKDSEEKFTDIISNFKKKCSSKCVFFSATLLGAENSMTSKYLEESLIVGHDTESKSSPLSAVSSKEVLDVLLRVPLLSDLNSWCHWDLRFAPKFGPLMGCLNEMNSKDLLCLVTRDGKILRTDPSATADSFLEAALQGSAYHTAAQLLSLISLNGRTHLPFSLLKCYAKRAFEVIRNNHFEEELNDRKSLVHMRGPVKFSASLEKTVVVEQETKMDKSDFAASKFLLDCLCYLPGEFRGLAVDVLLSGLRSVVKDAPTKVLSACKHTEQRIMLHDAGLLLGIVEWINDSHNFCSSFSPNSGIVEDASPSVDSSTGFVQKELGDRCHTEQRCMTLSEKSCDCSKESHESGQNVEGVGDLCDSVEVFTRTAPELHDNPVSVIDSIRRDEFGLDSSSSGAETSMLQKQHARLGRALQCLSQELYSQDSHFILELVQNADDNKYPEHVEPTLTFILENTGIVVLNNECGFMPENIRALCDVGRSTKKGSGGYIGKKGIGFKSVFRVSDAPEIHSNGFHIKFDISEGQIGYILPTVVPPHDIESLISMLSSRASQLKDAGWNTCITLPFRAIDSDKTTVNHIEAMFSDLHPSLLLFLHRLQCIVYRNMLDDSLLVMRKEVVSKNIVKVSCGENSMTWFVASEKVKAANIRDGVQTTEISIGFTLDMLEDGTYRSCMIQEPVFAFLPLRTYGLKFIIQGDFILTSSREDVDEDSPWNQLLLSEFPGLFVGALKSFCSLPSFTQNFGKAVSSYMQLVPLVGEVHGFFSSLPRSIISSLRTTNCLLLEGDSEWVPPCKVLRNWNEKIKVLLKDGLLQEHLALGFLDKDIVLSDSLSRALGIEDYGPKTLVQILSSLSRKKNCLQSMGFAWLSSILTELYMLFRSSGHGNVEVGIDKNLIDGLHRIPFIPLSNGKFTSLDEGPVWLHHDTTGFDVGDVFEAFPMLYGNLRTVDHSLLLASSVDENSTVDDLVSMLCAIGVQKLSPHEIIKVHILPAFEARSEGTPEGLMVDYLCFVMTHLRSVCHVCHSERKYIISELRSKALVLTNYGLKQLTEASVHFGEEFGNQVNMKKLTKNLDMLWHVVDGTYLKHPASKYYSCGLKEWRDFFQEIEIADFVQVVQVEKSIAECYSVLDCETYDSNLLSPQLAVRDWESPELVDLLSLLHKINAREGCKYLLEVLDTKWDGCYHDKTTVSFNSVTNGVIKSSKSSFMRVICDTQWIVSSMNNRLHLARELYHDCDDVRSILGMNAPYAVPKVTSVKLLNDIGFKTKVCLDDALEILEAWVRSGDSFKSSIGQITRFYKFLWNEMADSKQKITKKLHALPCVFVPHEIGSRQNDVISGMFLSLDDVYWNDSAGVLDEIREMSSQISSVVESLRRKTLCNIYPGLHDFFVNGCGVPETPSFQEYLKIIGQFAHYLSPSFAAKAVFKIFLKWSDDLKSGTSSEDVDRFKERLSELDYTVLPTDNDKWVSLHPSFGLVCWCDDDKLKKRFKKKDNVHFIYLGENAEEEQELLETKVSVLMHSLDIPSISKVVKREAIYEGLKDNSVTVSLVNWAMPYAQRYIFTLHRERYTQTKKTLYSQVKRLQVLVVEKLCYRNVIPQHGISSKKEFKCTSLLQDKALYTTATLDSHSLFMELSRLFSNGVPDLHLANFLHLIKTMAESGLSEEQMKSFVLNSQKVEEIPDGEKIWFLKSALKAKKKAGISLSWLPSRSSKEAHVDDSEQEIGSGQLSSSEEEEDVTEALEEHIQIESNDTNLVAGTSSSGGNRPNPLRWMHMNSGSTSGNHLNQNILHEWNNSVPSADFSEREQLHTGTPWAAQAQQTGRKGEEIAYRYFAAKHGTEAIVRWVNEQSETGLPYDLLIENRGGKKEYVEVKATVSTRKDYFNLTVREWECANEERESYIIAHVLLGNSNAILTEHRNPVKLCQDGHLRLLILMPNQRNEVNVAF